MKLPQFYRSSLSCLAAGALALLSQPASGQSIARQWNEELLTAIRDDFPAPNVHARNLFHLSAAMYDAWAAYDATAVGVFYNEAATAGDVETAREKAISFAAYRLLFSRAEHMLDPVPADPMNPLPSELPVRTRLTSFMTALGYDPMIVTTSGTSPEAVGNRIAAAIIARGNVDNSNQSDSYDDYDDNTHPTVANYTRYVPVNDPLRVSLPGIGAGLNDVNRWQPLRFDEAQTQNGLEADDTQKFVGAHWGYVSPFALSGPSTDGVYEEIDPGAPPYLSGDGMSSDLAMKQQVNKVIEFSGFLDNADATMIDISPASIGNNSLGQDDGTGHLTNPFDGQPYPAKMVRRADYARVIAEFWADGPDSETPPGHWNTVANEVNDNTNLVRKIGGTGPTLLELEWDVKLYLALNGALHDAAIAAWGVKREYDYVRPITLIRQMWLNGQSSDDMQPKYNAQGLLLEPGVVRLTQLPGFPIGSPPRDEIQIYAWGVPFSPVGPPPPPNVGWRPGVGWLPYQKATFVTPAFAGYVSGHSAFSRAAAEVLAIMTGSEYFPGGLGTFTYGMNELEFDTGPATDVELQWATYYDAADQAGISRIYGGIHVSADDGPGRIMGSKVGIKGAARALKFIDGSILDEFFCFVKPDGVGVEVSWPAIANYRYQLQSSPTPDFTGAINETTLVAATTDMITFNVATQDAIGKYYRVLRQDPVAP